VSVLVVGLSHQSAPVTVLERAAVGGDTLDKLLHDVVRLPDIAGTFVISTCNRVEVYAEVDRFHGGVAGVCELLSRHSGIPVHELTGCLYVHYEDRAVQHLLAVSSGLESVVVGEDQILGQVRSALKRAEEQSTLGRSLRDLGRLALRTGKRARSETGIDRLGLSLVAAGLELAVAASAGPPVATTDPGTGTASVTDTGTASVTDTGTVAAEGAPAPGPLSAGTLAGLNVLVVGAGAMSGLAVATAARAGAASVAVANRTREKAERLVAGLAGVVPSSVADLDNLTAALTAADLVISCTGAASPVITAPVVREVLAARGTDETGAKGRGLILLDLAMPRDVDPAVAGLPGVTLIDMDTLRGSGGETGVGVGAPEVAEVRAIVEQEFAAYVSAARAASVTPTVVALRAKAATVVDAELTRLAGRLAEERVSARALEEMAQTVRRVVDKLLHAPTVRVKELASSPDGAEYAAALRVLFDLDPRTVEAVTHAEVETPSATIQREGSQ
jgi:glutamyl-tRNA reductase